VRVIWLAALLSGISLCACSSRGTEAPKIGATSMWLRKACGVVLSAPPTRKAGAPARSLPPQGWTTWVEGTIVLAQSEVSTVLDALRKDKGLNLRGASATRYSFQSPDGRAVERECELDTGTRVLYFRYAE
jgi:hypothetical protein